MGRCSNCGQIINTDYSVPLVCPRCGVAFSNRKLTCVNCSYIGPASEFIRRNSLVGGIRGTCPSCSWDIQQIKDFENVTCRQCHKTFSTLRGKTVGALTELNRWGISIGTVRKPRGRLSGYRCQYCQTRMYASGEIVNELKARAKRSINLGITSVIASFVFLGVFFSIPGIIVAVKCLRDKRYLGLAITGLVLSLIGLAIEVILIVLAIQNGHVWLGPFMNT